MNRYKKKSKKTVNIDIKKNRFSENKADLGSVIRSLDLINGEKKASFMKENKFKNNKGFLLEDEIFT